MPHHRRHPNSSTPRSGGANEAPVPSVDAPLEVPRRLRPAPLWKRFRAICVVLVLLGVVELGAASLTASHFSVRGVRLAGLTNTPAQPVQRIAQQLVGQNWLRARSGKVVQAIEKIPTVDSVRVRRVWGLPLQLEVDVHERQPLVMIGGGNQWWMVDAKGIPYLCVNQPGNMQVDAVTGPQFRPQLGKPLPAEQWQQVTALLTSMQQDQSLDSNGFRWNLRRVYFDRAGNVSLRLKDAPHDELLVQIGTDQWAAKLKRARAALAFLDKDGRRASVLNLVSYKLPTWIPQSANPASNKEINKASVPGVAGAA